MGGEPKGASRVIKTVLLFSLCSTLCSQVAFADLAKDLEKSKDLLTAQEQKQREVMSSLFAMNQTVKIMVKEKSELEQKSAVLEASNQELAKKIMDMSALVKSQRSLLRKRIVALYKMGGQGLARILFASTDSQTLERNLKILGIVAEQDVTLIKSYFGQVAKLEKQKRKLASRIAEVKGLGEKIKAQEAKLESETKAKQDLLARVRKERDKTIQKIGRLREKDPFLDMLYQPSFYEAQGKLLSPISNATLSRRFGVVREALHNVSWLHKGQFYTVHKPESVESVFSGKVAFVGKLPGYGQSIIIDHGDHFYSVYAGVSAPKVDLGAEVKSRQPIALTASNLFENKQGLYFEIRHFSEPVDPQKWMKGKQL